MIQQKETMAVQKEHFLLRICLFWDGDDTGVGWYLHQLTVWEPVDDPKKKDSVERTCFAKKVWKYCPACSLVLMIQKKRLWQYRKNTFCLFWRKEIFCVPTSSFFLSVPFLNNHGGIAERSCFGKKIRKYFAFISFVQPRSCLQACSVWSQNKYAGIAERMCFAKKVQKCFASFLPVWTTFEKIPASAWDGSFNTWNVPMNTTLQSGRLST